MRVPGGSSGCRTGQQTPGGGRHRIRLAGGHGWRSPCIRRGIGRGWRSRQIRRGAGWSCRSCRDIGWSHRSRRGVRRRFLGWRPPRSRRNVRTSCRNGRCPPCPMETQEPATAGTVTDADEQQQQQDQQDPASCVAKKATRHLPVEDRLHIRPGLPAIRHGHLQQLFSPKVIMWLSFHHFFGSIEELSFSFRLMISFNCRLASFKCQRLVPSLIDSIAAISRWA